MFLTTGLSSAAQAAEEPPVTGTSWIVTLKPAFNPRDHGLAIASEARGDLGLIYEHALNGFVFHGTEAEAALVSRNPLVRTVVPDLILRIADETVPTGISRIRAEHAT
ncbi:MAG TPA: protease inhibitor I9 family protein, partial [Acidimicrobiia bacterium]|nr:protease inhibitor I9 family protein [Acidimicrobiia bacterium]